MTLMMERPQPIQPTGEPGFEELCQTLETMDVPVGFRAEIIRGGIVLSPWSQGFYLNIMDSLADQLAPHAPKGHRVSQAPCLYEFPHQSRAFGPDVHVADREAVELASSRLPGDALSLVAELTSRATADNDRRDKVERYGMAGIPVYILVDMLLAKVVVFSSPTANGYKAQDEIKFGETIHVPAPFDCELDTSDWKAKP